MENPRDRSASMMVHAATLPILLMKYCCYHLLLKSITTQSGHLLIHLLEMSGASRETKYRFLQVYFSDGDDVIRDSIFVNSTVFDDHDGRTSLVCIESQ